MNSIRQDIKNLAAILAEEEDAAMDLWSCLPSHKEACERHGENALSYCPNPRAVMREAEEAFRVLADHDSEDRTGLLSFFGCRCDTHDHTPTEETVEAVLGLYQPGFRWGQGLVDFDAEVDAGVLDLVTKQRDAALAEVERLKQELSVTTHLAIKDLPQGWCHHPGGVVRHEPTDTVVVISPPSDRTQRSLAVSIGVSKNYRSPDGPSDWLFGEIAKDVIALSATPHGDKAIVSAFTDLSAIGRVLDEGGIRPMVSVVERVDSLRVKYKINVGSVRRHNKELAAANEEASGQKARADALAEALGECERQARTAANLDLIDHQAALWVVARNAHGALATHGATDAKQAGPSDGEIWQAYASGQALLDLQDQLKRLMATPCSSMAFGFGPEETAKAVTSEVAEILAEPAGSEAAQRECAGLLAAAVRMTMVHGADPVEAMRSEALRLKTRLDTMDRLACSWATAKIVEKDPRLERLWVVVTMDAIQCEISAWFVDGEDPHVAVVPREKITITNGILIGDCFPTDRDVRILPIEDARGWWDAIFSAEQAGYLVAIRDEQGARFEKAKP